MGSRRGSTGAGGGDDDGGTGGGRGDVELFRHPPTVMHSLGHCKDWLSLLMWICFWGIKKYVDK